MAERGTETAQASGDPIFEEIRRLSLRSFRVQDFAGQAHVVIAHYHNGGEGNFLNFVVVESSGRQTIVEMFNCADVKHMVEITNPEAQQHLSRLQELAARKYQRLMKALNPELPANVTRTPKGIM